MSLVQADYKAQKGLLPMCRTVPKGNTFGSELMPIEEIDDVLGSEDVLITQIPESDDPNIYERGREEESLDDVIDDSQLHSGRRLDLLVNSDGEFVLSLADQDDTKTVIKSRQVELNSVETSDDEDYETDLEFDEERWLNPGGRDHDTTGRSKYLKVCEDLGVSPASYFLRHIQDKEMTMKFHGLGKNNTKAICIPLETNTEIEKLNLSGNGIDTDGALSLIRVLKENFFITDLVLAENKIGSVGARAVCDLLLSNRTLVNVDLTGNKIDDSTATFFHEVLIKNQTLKKLRLNHNRFEESAAVFFKGALMENESLEVLDLSWNHFGTRGAVLLAEGLQENVGLKQFCISMAGLGRDGAEAIGRALKHNRTLLELDISYSRIPSEGVLFIASGIKENDVLQILKLGFNPFGAEAAMALLKSLESNESSAINLLDLSNSLVKREFVELLEKLTLSRPIHVLYDGVLPECQHARIPLDEMVKFRQDTINVFKHYISECALNFDNIFKSEENLISQDEFRNILKIVPELVLTKEQVNILCKKLTVDSKIDLSKLRQEAVEEEEETQT